MGKHRRYQSNWLILTSKIMEAVQLKKKKEKSLKFGHQKQILKNVESLNNLNNCFQWVLSILIQSKKK